MQTTQVAIYRGLCHIHKELLQLSREREGRGTPGLRERFLLYTLYNSILTFELHEYLVKQLDLILKKKG